MADAPEKAPTPVITSPECSVTINLANTAFWLSGLAVLLLGLCGIIAWAQGNISPFSHWYRPIQALALAGLGFSSFMVLREVRKPGLDIEDRHIITVLALFVGLVISFIAESIPSFLPMVVLIVWGFMATLCYYSIMSGDVGEWLKQRFPEKKPKAKTPDKPKDEAKKDGVEAPAQTPAKAPKGSQAEPVAV